MKKIFIVTFFVGLIFLSGRVFGDQIGCNNTCQPGEIQLDWPACNCIPDGGANQGGSSSNCPAENVYQSGGRTFCCEYPLENGICVNCPSNRIYTSNGHTLCCPGVLDDSGHCDTSLSDVGINISTDCLLNGQCGLNIYKVLGIRKSDQNPTVLGFFQDITLATTTAFLGTVIIIAIIISGLFFAFASITGKDTKRAKSILIDSFVGLLMVMGSYAIIRLIQFLATAGS